MPEQGRTNFTLPHKQGVGQLRLQEGPSASPKPMLQGFPRVWDQVGFGYHHHFSYFDSGKAPEPVKQRADAAWSDDGLT